MWKIDNQETTFNKSLSFSSESKAKEAIIIFGQFKSKNAVSKTSLTKPGFPITRMKKNARSTIAFCQSGLSLL